MRGEMASNALLVFQPAEETGGGGEKVAQSGVMEKYGVLGVEMEAAGIYGVAAEFGAKALTICTVSDHIRTHEQTTAAERQTTFNDMIKIALESVLLGDQE